jgi:UDP-glucuronate 4-epimerase
MGHSYAHLFKTPMTFFRFFTVYGPWGRPDMALFKFTKAIARRRADRRLQQRQHGPRLHLYRRPGGIDRAADQCGARRHAGRGRQPLPRGALPRRQYRRGPADPVDGLYRRGSSARWASRRSRTSCRCSRAMSPPPRPARPNCWKALTGYASPHTPPSAGVPAFIEWYLDALSKLKPLTGHDAQERRLSTGSGVSDELSNGPPMG